MDALLTQVVISFRPLLKQITRCLDFPDPEYQYLNLRKSIACVAIRSENSVVPTVYLGGDTNNVDESCEIAAKKAAYDLIKRYDIIVEDVTALHKQMYERCGLLYGYKKEELEAIEKGKSKVYFHGDISTEIGHNQRRVVIDFLEVLRFIFRCVDAAAKQDLARKAFDYLINVCILEIVDANYRATTCRFDVLLCVLERESYLSAKERVLGVKEQPEPTSSLVEQDCMVPVGEDFQASMPNPPVIAFNKIELKSQVAESFAISDSSIEEIPKGADSEDLHGRFDRVRLLKD
uniref:Uncharacterized protein n=1 Tax=Chenopodium quinoa TaxID=63459 RepID=A0A803N851_CHEQI